MLDFMNVLAEDEQLQVKMLLLWLYYRLFFTNQ